MKESKGILLMLGGLILVLLVLTYISKPGKGVQLNLKSATPLPNLTKLTIGNTVVMVTVANTEATREKGLGGVTSLSDAQGMLFVFDSHQITPTFWMKGMLIPLDFIWISNNKVAQIDTNVAAPAPNTSDTNIQRVVPTVPIDEILEVNAGFVMKNLIKVGDSVSLGN